MYRPAFSPPPLPLLITGIAGVAGYNAFDYFRARYPGQVVGIRQRDNFRLVGEGVVACDAEDRDELKRLFDRYAFRSVLDCAGNCALRACELDHRLAWRVNVEGVQNLLAVIGAADVRLVHLSVDLVFSGNGTGGLREDDPTDPVTVYGKTMVAAEGLLTAEAPWACTLRISLPMGVSFNGHAGAIDWIQSRFKKLKPATLYFDEVRTPTYTDCLNELCETMLGNRLTGLFHAGGPRPLSLFQIAQVINRVGGYPADHLMGCPRAAAGPIPPRAGDVSMNSDKLTRALGYVPFHSWPYDDALVPTHRDWHHERPRGWPGSKAFLEEVLYRNPLRRRHEVA
ncbi:MAG TPA: sugar nucleotide-binding protein [Pirellulales bacterium]|nr:sugar nucleotide-binding protein [Pirellulales bacterium]